MSAGAFLNTGYEAESGTIFPIRVQPESLTLTLNGTANDAPAAAPAINLPSAQVGKGRRAIGVNARLVRFKITDATPPAGYKADGLLTLPVLQIATYTAYGKGQTGTYTLNGTAYAVAYVGKSPETIV